MNDMTHIKKTHDLALALHNYIFNQDAVVEVRRVLKILFDDTVKPTKENIFDITDVISDRYSLLMSTREFMKETSDKITTELANIDKINGMIADKVIDNFDDADTFVEEMKKRYQLKRLSDLK